MADPHARITEIILRQIDAADPGTWMCPWHRTHGGLPRNALTGRSYCGINVLSLWCGAQAAGYTDGRGERQAAGGAPGQLWGRAPMTISLPGARVSLP